MNVVSMSDFASRDTVELARWMVEHAAHIAGAGVTIRMRDGDQHTVFTGIYKRQPTAAAGVALRLSIKLANAADTTFG